MPLKIITARNAKTKNLYIRGTHLRVAVDKSCGTDRRSVASQMRDDIERAIERGEYPPREAAPRPDEPTFLTAALAYLQSETRSRGMRRSIARLIKHFGETPLSGIHQEAIDEAALLLHPNVTPGTRNAAVYTPLSAILHHAKVDIKVRRPRGAKGRVVTDWISHADANAIVTAAEEFDQEFGLLLRFLLYTGVRLGEAVKLQWADVRLDERAVWVRRQKEGIPSDVMLTADLCERLRGHYRPDGPRRVFRLHQGGHLKHQLVRAKLAALGLPCPARRPTGWKQPANRLEWVNFHSFRHTWATWMRRYAKADVKDLVATDNWRDERSAGRYTHAVAREAWEKVNLLPEVGKIRGVRIA